MDRTFEEVARKMDALNLWSAIAPYNWAVKPLGTVFPYFCSTMPGDEGLVKVRFLMLEGWQTLHDFVRTRVDRSFGFYTSPIEFPHLELVILKNGEPKLFRHDTGFMPSEANERQKALAARLLWEAYGVMLRLESDPKLPMRYAGERSVFARLEKSPGVWEDCPLEIPPPPPYVEKISFDKADLARAKDRPFVNDAVLHVDFALAPNIMTKEPRPRSVYRLVAFDPATKETVIDQRVSIHPEIGLKGLWESMPAQFLKLMIERGRIPGEIKVGNPRMFRMIRPLCMELPFKLSLHDRLEFA